MPWNLIALRFVNWLFYALHVSTNTALSFPAHRLHQAARFWWAVVSVVKGCRFAVVVDKPGLVSDRQITDITTHTGVSPGEERRIPEVIFLDLERR